MIEMYLSRNSLRSDYTAESFAKIKGSKKVIVAFKLSEVVAYHRSLAQALQPRYPDRLLASKNAYPVRRSKSRPT
jgi:hypothetical protein